MKPSPKHQAARGLAVVDIGNARIKWARVVEGRIAAQGSALHAGDFESGIDALAKGLPGTVERIVAANVAGPAAADRLAAFARERYGIDVELVVPKAEALGVTCGYREPSRLGADRWAALIAAHALGRASGAARPVCAINAGSAYTLDAVDAGGRHLGGLIFAGPRIAADALARNTRRIGRTAAAQGMPIGVDLLGKSTDEAVGHAAMLGPAAAFDRAVRVVADALGARPAVYVAGGDAELLARWLETQAEVRADLVLEGLTLLAADPPPVPTSASE
ncbi:MAG TPA: type III pantothenate kinase [Gammaproteobacteria bacterium]|nr:type III pantothenate kinase [Gammaproteobacteria bacterium]